MIFISDEFQRLCTLIHLWRVSLITYIHFIEYSWWGMICYYKFSIFFLLTDWSIRASSRAPWTVPISSALARDQARGRAWTPTCFEWRHNATCHHGHGLLCLLRTQLQSLLRKSAAVRWFRGKHSIMCQNWAGIGLMLPTVSQFRSSSGMIRGYMGYSKILGEPEFCVAWCCQPLWMGHRQHPNLKMEILNDDDASKIFAIDIP